MGLDGVKLEKDYAAEYAKKVKASDAQVKESLLKAGVTIPIKNKNENKEAGLKVENAKSEVYLKTPNTLINEKAIEKAEYDARVKFYAARAGNDEIAWTNEDIKKFGKENVKNQIHKEKFEQTYVCYDKDEYERLSAKREEEFDKLVKQFRNDGLSKKEAKAKANSMLYNYEYLKKGALGLGGRPRKFVENHKELFFENGKFSNEKYHEFVLNMANTVNADNKRAKKMGFTGINGGISTEDYNSYLEKAKGYTGGDEAKAKQLLADMDIKDNGKQAMETNYELHLKESRDVIAPKLKNVDGMDDATPRKLRAVARKGGMETEADNTPAYKLASAVVLGYIGHQVIPGIKTASESGSITESAANAAKGSASAGAASDAIADAAASAKVNPGSLLGIAGLAAGDPGKKVNGVPRLPERKPTVPPAQTETVTGNPPCNNEECKIEKVDVPTEVEKAIDTCGMDIKKGQTLYDAARDALGNTINVKGKIADKNPAQTKRLTNLVKSYYGLKPGDAPVGRTHFEFPTSFEGKEVNCKASIHGTNKGTPKTVKGRINNGTLTEQKEKVTINKPGLKDCNNNVRVFDDVKTRDDAFNDLSK